jgi:hypothetical protein
MHRPSDAGTGRPWPSRSRAAAAGARPHRDAPAVLRALALTAWPSASRRTASREISGACTRFSQRATQRAAQIGNRRVVGHRPIISQAGPYRRFRSLLARACGSKHISLTRNHDEQRVPSWPGTPASFPPSRHGLRGFSLKLKGYLRSDESVGDGGRSTQKGNFLSEEAAVGSRHMRSGRSRHADAPQRHMKGWAGHPSWG